MHNKTLKELSALLHSKQISATELTNHYLQRIGASPHNAFLHVDPALSLAQARAADARLAEGTAGPLTGIPIAHKDIFVTRDWRSTAGSKMLGNYTSPFDATVVENFNAAGMVTLGKLNCDEFAMGSANENSAFGAVLNPWDVQAVPGGSSGGASCDRDRHRRLDPPAGCVLRRYRHQADLRPRVALRHDCLRLLAGPGWADGTDGGRLRDAAQ
jgi:aspartyl-tRNA(Asn)/glutamyl-tRNA(Gln) amidotransferase subunit A